MQKTIFDNSSRRQIILMGLGIAALAFVMLVSANNALAASSLSITKSASPMTYNTAGQAITYTYTVNNTGDVNITEPINVTDNKIGTFRISNSGLIINKNVTGTSTYTITQADIDAGSVTNQAFANGTYNGDEVKSANAIATVTAIQSPALTLANVPFPTTYSAVGQTITYTYVVFNSGNVNTTGLINVTDNKTGTVNISSGLAPGQSAILKANYTITQADIDTGSVTDQAFANCTYNGTAVKSANAIATVTATQNPALLTVKVASSANYSTVGQNITYTYNVTNSGNVGIAGPINVTDNKTGTVKISDSGLAPSQYATGTANYTITQADIYYGYVTNEAFATGTFKNTTVNSPHVTATVTANQTPALTLARYASPTNYSAVGQKITYTYIVADLWDVGIAGPINVTDNKIGTVKITDSGVGPGVQYVTGTANYTITQADIDAGYVTSEAFATGKYNSNKVNSTNVTATVTAIQSPALMTVKVASPITYSTAGQNITYTYNVTNSGNVNITGPINITDNRTAIVKITDNGLAPGQSFIGKVNYTVTQADIDFGSVTNEAFASGTCNGAIVNSTHVTATVTAIQNPAMITVKFASPTTYSTVGQKITYTYNVTNSGNVNITGPINVTDNKTGAVKISDSGLAPGQYATGTANYTITQADIDSGYVINEAFATAIRNGNKVNSTHATATATAIQSPALISVKLTSPTTYSTIGQNITYTYIVFNSGNVNITGPIDVTDNKTGTVKISNSGLAAGQSATATANYTITQADVESGSVTNAAFATGMFKGTAVNSPHVIAKVIAIQLPVLTTVKIASPTNYSTVGQKITYTYNVTNSGNVGIAGPINVTDNKIGTVKISDSGLVPGQYVTGTANYTITQADIDAGSVTNAAFATGKYNGTAVNSNTATATVPVVQSPLALITVKFASPTTYSTVGQKITYTYIVINSWNAGITGPINVTDNKIGLVNISNSGLAPGQSATGTANYTITQADIYSGSVTNEAFATGKYNGTTVKSANVTAAVTAIQSPALTTVKVASPTTYSTVGQKITYTYNVTNSWNVSIGGPINVTDNKTGAVKISDSGLAPGQSATGTANYTITQADIDAGSVTNAAFATGTINGTEVKSTNVIAKVTAIPSPAPITAFPGCVTPPTDPNHDGLYEDINGNGRIDFADVVTYYNNMAWITQNGLTAYFDYNHNGRIDFNDVVMLYNMIG